MKGFFHHAGTSPAVRLLSLMLVATLLCGFGIFSAIGYEGDDSAVAPEQDASVVLDEADVPAEEVAEEPAEETAEEPAEETVEEPAEDPVESEEAVSAAEESAEEVLPVEEDIAVPAEQGDSSACCASRIKFRVKWDPTHFTGSAGSAEFYSARGDVLR